MSTDCNTTGMIVGAVTTVVSGAYLIKEFAFGPPSRRLFTTTKTGTRPNPAAAPGVECPCRDPRFDAACVGTAVGIALLIFFKNRHVKSIQDGAANKKK